MFVSTTLVTHPPQRGKAWNWSVFDDQGLRDVLKLGEFPTWLKSNPGQAYWIVFHSGVASAMRFHDMTWLELTKISRTYRISLFDPSLLSYRPWTGNSSDCRLFTGVIIERSS